MASPEKSYEAGGTFKETPEGATLETARDSIDTVASSEAQREKARSTNPNGFSRIQSGVDVKAAEAEFADLQRELSRISQASRKQFSRVQSRKSVKAVSEKDVEKEGTSDEGTLDEFDLEQTLRGNYTVSFAISQSGWARCVN